MMLRLTGLAGAVWMSLSLVPCLARADTAAVASPAVAPVHVTRAHGFALTDTVLPRAETASANLAQTVSATQPADGFAPAPLPDSDVEAPRNQARDLTAPTLEPDFFERSKHQVGDGFSSGSHISDQRRGHGSAAAGLQLSMPLSQ